MIQRVVAHVLVAIGLVVAFVFAFAAFVILALAGVAAWAWWRWKAPRAPAGPGGGNGGRIIEGEAVTVHESPARIDPPDRDAR